MRPAVLALVLGLAAPVMAQQTHDLPPRSYETERGTKIGAPFVVATVGDIIMPQPLERSGPSFTALTEVIRKADVGFANMESSLVDFAAFPGPFAGTIAPLTVGDSIKAMGIDLVSRANNHALDGGVAGMVSTDTALDRLGIVHAGSGDNLQEARAAKFLETGKGRVALVSMFSIEDIGMFGPGYVRTEATPRVGSIGGGSGIAPLHLTTFSVVSPAQLSELKTIAGAVYGERKGASAPAIDGHGERFRFFGQWYEAGSDPGALRYEINPGDKRAVLDSIRNGKVQSDFLIATIHSHQATRFCGSCAFEGVQGKKEPSEHYPPDFLVALAHAAIDEGADMFVTHGVHALAGVEIYKGRPIFYGLSNFVFQFGLQFGSGYDALENHRKRAELEDPESQEAVLATSRFEGGKLVEVRLYPVDLGGARRPISQMGIPLVPAAPDARRILEKMQEYSRPFGTTIAIEKGIGIVRIGSSNN
jgi:poly-gamma-glutamate synthesis protein (capsule biosynthesis protein)